MQSDRFELKNDSLGVTVPTILHSIKISMNPKASVIDIIEKSIGRSDHFTNLNTL